MLNVSRRSVATAAKIERDAIPEVAQAVERGHGGGQRVSSANLPISQPTAVGRRRSFMGLVSISA